jgi:hypothetical protein
MKNEKANGKDVPDHGGFNTLREGM